MGTVGRAEGIGFPDKSEALTTLEMSLEYRKGYKSQDGHPCVYFSVFQALRIQH